MWHNKYYNKYDTLQLEQFIEKLKDNNKEKTIESKVIQLEIDYTNKLKDLEKLCSSPNDITIIKQDYSINILQRELDIIKLLTKYSLLNNNLDYNFFMKSLSILLDFSETLRLRLGQKEIIIDNKDPNTITRCSYKFCSYKDNCTYNYNLKSKNLCYQNHYVHNMVSADLKILINYINNKYNSNMVIMHNKDILKTINTLSFVINHMESELKTKCLYLQKSEWNKCHVIKYK
jgi:acetone carboxylase gamma subunit